MNERAARPRRRSARAVARRSPPAPLLEKALEAGAVREIARAAAGATDPAALLRAALLSLAGAMGAQEACAVWLPRPGADPPAVAGTTGLPRWWRACVEPPAQPVSGKAEGEQYGVALTCSAAGPDIRVDIRLEGGARATFGLGARFDGAAYGPAHLALCRECAALLHAALDRLALAEARWEERRARLAVQGLFEQFVAPQVVERLLAAPDAVSGAQRVVAASVLMADLRGFARFVERADLGRIGTLMDRFYATAAAAASAHGGTIDKFTGDGLLAIFTEPADAAHAARAVGAAQELRSRCAAAIAGSGLGLGVGIASGDVLYGPFGSGRRADFTAIGPAVNLAARLAKRCADGEILVDEPTRLAAPDAAAYQACDVPLLGLAAPPRVWRVHAAPVAP